MRILPLALAAALLWPASASADPCGMVPPIRVPDGVTGPAIERAGAQRTWVMFKDGVQTIALRPGFVGKVEEFGMLIPFPAVPALRKVDDSLFAHIEGAVDPPEVTVRFQEIFPYEESVGAVLRSSAEVGEPPLALQRDEVVVLKEEAVGMYEVAVLAAGGAQALQKWMTRHEYRYPEGMDAVVEDYVTEQWVFVAIKTSVGGGVGAHARPGMRTADVSFPVGSSFDGHVQGMGFRFEVEAPVVPMRLSVFNGPDPRNVVYMLTEEGVRIDGVADSLVVRQVGGAELEANLTALLPVRYEDGTAEDVMDDEKPRIEQARDPNPVNGIARDLIASDLLAAAGDGLSLPFEEEEKELLRISEALGLRGEAIDGLHSSAIADQRSAALAGSLTGLRGMTLTVVDGVLPGDLLASRNLTFSPYRLPPARNQRRADPIRPTPPVVWVMRR